MKKIILATLALVLINFNLFAQDIQQDITYYRLLNKLWTMSNSFDKVSFHLDNKSVKMVQTRNAEMEVIDKLVVDASEELKLLKSKNYSTKSLEQLEEMLVAMEGGLAELKGEKWTSEPTWQYNYNLVKMQLGELETKKPKSYQLSKTDR